jgi:outer membrane protein assembly factor BamD (BamD/ComL family)
LEQHPRFILSPAVQLALGSQMAKNNDYQHAAETIVKIPYTFPEAPEGEVSLLRSGQLYLQHLNQPTVALQLFETFLQRYPHSPWVPQAQQASAAARQKIGESTAKPAAP